MKWILVFFISATLLSCGSINPKKDEEKLSKADEQVDSLGKSSWENPAKIEIFGGGLYPKALPDGQHFTFSGENHKGLWLFDIRNHEKTEITEARGAGFDPFISARYLLHMENGKRRKWILINKETDSIEEFKTKQAALYSMSHGLSDTTFAIVSEQLDSLILFMPKGRIVKIKPGKYQNYTSAEVSPSKDRILFEVSGKGAFICDFKGNILEDLGALDQTTWLSNQEVIFLKTSDDGMEIKSSTLHLMDLKTRQVIDIAKDLEGILNNPTVLRSSKTIVATWNGNKLIGFNKVID